MLVFIVPLFGVFTFLHRNYLWAKRKIIFITISILFLYSFIADNVAIRNQVWNYGNNKIVGLWVLGVPIEDLIFSLLISFGVSSSTLVALKKIRDKSSFVPELILAIIIIATSTVIIAFISAM